MRYVERRLAYHDKMTVRAALDRILAWDFERIVQCHGDPITTDARAVLRDSFSWL